MKPQISTCSKPTLRQNVLFVERLVGNETKCYVIYSESMYGYLTHYNGKTVPCWENHDYCEGGHKEETLRENFLLQAYSQTRGKQVFLYLTPGAAKQLLEQIPEGTSLRGLCIRVTRTEKNKGRLHVQVEEHKERRRLVTPLIDPRESIMRFLRVPKEVQEGQGRMDVIPLPAEDVAPPRRKRLKALGG